MSQSSGWLHLRHCKTCIWLVVVLIHFGSIGWDWVKAALINGWKLIDSVVFTKNQYSTPTMAFRKQHEQRLYRLEFQLQT